MHVAASRHHGLRNVSSGAHAPPWLIGYIATHGSYNKASCHPMDMSSISSIAHGTSWESIVNWIVAYIGASTAFPALASNGVIWDSVKLLILGSVVETGRRLFRWVVDRFKIRMFPL